jgi:2-methylcitrate dehydratase
VISHETVIRHVLAGNPSEQGFDQGTAIAMGVAAGASNLLGLTREQTEHAVSIATTGNMHLRATRSGELSMWKGCATALAVRNAVHAVLLAADGMSGPPEPFRGRHGLADHYPSFEWTPYGPNADDFHIEKANLKFWAVANQMQAAAWCGIELGKQIDADQIESIAVEANEFAHFESGSEPAKWDPQTKETADHSLPYILAWGLMHGAIGTDAFEPKAYLDPAMRPFLQKITVTVNEQFTEEYPVEMHMRATATAKDGKQCVADVLNPIGHPKNPMTMNDIEAKFTRLSGEVLGAKRASEAFSMMQSMEKIENIASVFDAISATKP